jgi:zinc transport system ATP-binding protein
MMIDCKNVTMSYDNYIAVKNVSFKVEQGDYLCIVGENGSGKSTLMKGILKLLPLVSGSIEFDGIEQREIGYLPQQTIVQKDFPASVYEVILSGCLSKRGFWPFYSKKEKTLADEKMIQLDIKHLKNKSYRDLSGGQQQRVLLARALCSTDKLIVLDEPVTGLDPVVTVELYQLIKRLNSDLGVAVIMISHDIHGVLPYVNKILHLNKEPIFYGTVSDYRASKVGQNMMGGSLNDRII